MPRVWGPNRATDVFRVDKVASRTIYYDSMTYVTARHETGPKKSLRLKLDGAKDEETSRVHCAGACPEQRWTGIKLLSVSERREPDALSVRIPERGAAEASLLRREVAGGGSVKLAGVTPRPAVSNVAQYPHADLLP